MKRNVSYKNEVPNLKVIKKEFSPINKIISRFEMSFNPLGIDQRKKYPLVIFQSLMKKNCPLARKTLSCFPLASRRNDDVFEKGARSIARLNFHFHPLQQANSPSFLFYPHPRRTRVSTPTVISIFTAGRGAAVRIRLCT